MRPFQVSDIKRDWDDFDDDGNSYRPIHEDALVGDEKGFDRISISSASSVGTLKERVTEFVTHDMPIIDEMMETCDEDYASSNSAFTLTSTDHEC